MRSFLVVAALSAAVVCLGACACPKASSGGSASGAAATACPMCAKGMAGETVWCEHCKAGFVGGEKVSCAGCYAAKTGGPPCPKCSGKM
jgi:hypothetical protein